MRAVRMLFLALVAVLLVTVALANRDIVSLRALPTALDPYVGGPFVVQLPMFLVLFLAVAIGVVAGLIWEFLRESQLRAESARRARDIAQLEREVGGLRATHAAPRDEVLAILDAPKVPARR